MHLFGVPLNADRRPFAVALELLDDAANPRGGDQIAGIDNAQSLAILIPKGPYVVVIESRQRLNLADHSGHDSLRWSKSTCLTAMVSSGSFFK